jgi:hypothetical protein
VLHIPLEPFVTEQGGAGVIKHRADMAPRPVEPPIGPALRRRHQCSWAGGGGAMKFPERTSAHVTETESWRLLQALALKEWVVREVSERDYGIDAYIELIPKAGQITGQLMSVQLKGEQAIDWRPSEGGLRVASSPSVKTTTAAYWLGLPVPVFLFVADLTAENIHFVAVQEGIRAQFDKLDSQKTISFALRDKLDLRSEVGLSLLDRSYARERRHEQFSFHITNLINQIDAFADFIRVNQNRDIFMEVEAERHLQFRALHESCRMASLYLEHEWTVESLSDLYAKDRDKWKDETVYLHEQTLDRALQKIEMLFPALVRKALALVSETQANYWRNKDPVFFSLCSGGELEWMLRRLEKEAGQ